MNTSLHKPNEEPVQVANAAPLRWLARGWDDFERNPGPGVLHGLGLTLFGWLLLWFARDQFWLLAGMFSGFLIVAPIITVGLYQVSRSCSVGHCMGMREVAGLWMSGDGRLVRFGLLLSLAGTGWVLTSAALITAYSPAPIRSPADFFRLVVLSESSGLFEVWMILGGLLAAPMFASSVLAIPMLVDTRASVMQAVSASWRAVAVNPLPMTIWAWTIIVLVGWGMLTGLFGLVVLVPVLAHASWHAYCELTGVPDPTGPARLSK
jgi:uncharacterized membrane protein